MGDFIQNTGDWVMLGFFAAAVSLVGIILLMPPLHRATRRFPESEAALDARGRINTGLLIFAGGLILAGTTASMWWNPEPFWALRTMALALMSGVILGWGIYRTTTGWFRLQRLRQRRTLFGPLIFGAAAVWLAFAVSGVGLLIILFRLSKINKGKPSWR